MSTEQTFETTAALIENRGWMWSICSLPPRSKQGYTAIIFQEGAAALSDRIGEGTAKTPARALHMAFQMACETTQVLIESAA
jgi:hypothetical protein